MSPTSCNAKKKNCIGGKFSWIEEQKWRASSWAQQTLVFICNHGHTVRILARSICKKAKNQWQRFVWELSACTVQARVCFVQGLWWCWWGRAIMNHSIASLATDSVSHQINQIVQALCTTPNWNYWIIVFYYLFCWKTMTEALVFTMFKPDVVTDIWAPRLSGPLVNDYIIGKLPQRTAQYHSSTVNLMLVIPVPLG